MSAAAIDPFVLRQAEIRASRIVGANGYTPDDWEDLRQELLLDYVRRQLRGGALQHFLHRADHQVQGLLDGLVHLAAGHRHGLGQAAEHVPPADFHVQICGVRQVGRPNPHFKLLTGALADGQEPWPLTLQAADAVPAAVQEEHAAPGIEAVGDERRIVASAEVCAQLRLARGARVYCLQRLRLADDEPIGYLVSYVPETLAEGIDRSALDQGGSTDYLRNLPAMHESCVERSIEAVAAGEPEAKLLRIKRGLPLLSIQRLITAKDGRPIEFLRALYRGDRMKFQVTCG